MRGGFTTYSASVPKLHPRFISVVAAFILRGLDLDYANAASAAVTTAPPVELTVAGHNYKNARLTLVDSASAGIIHSTGVARIAIADLSDEQIAALNVTSKTAKIVRGHSASAAQSSNNSAHSSDTQVRPGQPMSQATVSHPTKSIDIEKLPSFWSKEKLDRFEIDHVRLGMSLEEFRADHPDCYFPTKEALDRVATRYGKRQFDYSAIMIAKTHAGPGIAVGLLDSEAADLMGVSFFNGKLFQIILGYTSERFKTHRIAYVGICLAVSFGKKPEMSIEKRNTKWDFPELKRRVELDISADANLLITTTDTALESSASKLLQDQASPFNNSSADGHERDR
jgi:hypothetical protein